MDGVMDSERRPLRPIGASVDEVNDRTGRMLAVFTRRPGVRLFGPVPAGAGQTPIPYAISKGPLVVLVDAVAWPAGTYSTTPDGNILCDGVYIGQSVRQLVGAVHRLRRTMPRGCLVEAVIVVHPSLPAAPTLPAAGPAELSWLPPADLPAHLRHRLSVAAYCQSDINAVTLSLSPVTPGS
ncbi:hypothetical protein [Actinoplanes sp. NBRC 103695]|uniref:hypothetical protein n=1 Tax=Actinoplanes sp. NBRC 103695 TaxID=3032202 RepID=UPI00255648AE|nr:hypothetical protein [Actinoplanes sp. NBRC 103695]